MTPRQRRAIARQLREFEAAVREARASVKAGRGYHVISEAAYLRTRADRMALAQIRELAGGSMTPRRRRQ